MREIRAEAKTVRQLLSGTRYSIDYYQREYKWQTKQVRELIEDLSDTFFDSYKPNHEREAVQRYEHYFLGSIILSAKNDRVFIIDGQQRLTTITLLLTYLQNAQGQRPDRVKLEDLIFSEKYGRKSFNLDVDERTPCMEALYGGETSDPSDGPESVKNIGARYKDIQQLFPSEIGERALPFFADWFIENVHLVEIVALSDDDAYKIFETMNDRGLSLTPLDMLKGYLLASITDDRKRLGAGKAWKEQLGPMADLGKDEDADAVKAWLRGQYAQTIRDRTRGAQPGDFDRLGTEFHRWVREHDDAIGLKASGDFVRFIERDMSFYVGQYARLREGSFQLEDGLESLYAIGWLEFTLQYPLLLAALKVDDSAAAVKRKVRIVASFIDIMLARRLWNWKSISYSTMQYFMFGVVKEARAQSAGDLVRLLKKRLKGQEETFEEERFGLTKMNRPAVKWLLARMTDHLERSSGLPSKLADYLAGGRQGYEVEHIWADHAELHGDEFEHQADFGEQRNRIGGLLLLPKSFNASYGDLPYEDKIDHYFGQNLLAKSLNQKCYKHNPGFKRYVERSGLPFRAHTRFKRSDLEARQDLYRRLAQEVWSPTRLDDAAAS